MDTDFEADEDHVLVRRSVGPVVLLLPFACALLAISFLMGGSSNDVGQRAQPPVHGSDADVEGWQGELTLDNGVRWRATLGPLHSDGVRQSFDSQALAAHFELPVGQVFKLVLTDLSPESVSGKRPLPVPQNGSLVSDKDGVALSLLCDKPGDLSNSPADPLQVLLANSDSNVAPLGSTSWILWGRAPGIGAQIIGFEGGLHLALEARMLPREQVDVALLVREQ